MKRYSKNFERRELLVTNTGLPNTPLPESEDRLFWLCQFSLQRIRDKFGKIYVSSGFRSPAVNERVGGQSTSQHLKGEAVDFFPVEADIEKVFDWCVNNLIYGQLILETRGDKKLIHISLPRLRGPDQQAMVSPVYGDYMFYFNGEPK